MLLPHSIGEQVVFQSFVLSTACDPDIARTQLTAQFGERAQLLGMPVDPLIDKDVLFPLSRDEGSRGQLRDASSSGLIELVQQRECFQQGVITFFRTIFPAKPSQIENEPENSQASPKTEPSGLMC
jgi:hypothetical protein